MTKDTFSEQIRAFVERTQDKLDRVASGAASDVLAEAAGNAPVDTGRLRDSLEVEINGVPIGNGPAAAELVAFAARAGDRIQGEWTAPYAVRAERGDAHRAPARFVGRAVQRWPAIVEANARKVKDT